MQFHVATLVTITDGHLIAPNHMDDVYAILNYMTGDNLFTHQLTRAAEECQPALLEQHPWLAGVPELPDGMEHDVIMDVVANLVNTYGQMHEVQPLKPEEHTRIDPVAEARMNFPNAKIIAVDGGHITAVEGDDK